MTFQSKTLDSQIEYSYTPNGQIETIAQSGPNATSKVVKYSYDLAGRTTQIERSEPPLPSGNPPTVPAFASFLTTTFGYRDSQGKKSTRIQSMSHTAPNSTLASSTLLASYSLGWDPGGRLVSMTSTADDAATFTYDRTDQLKSATYDKPAYADLNFSYDANGNRTGGGNTPGPDNRQASDGVSDFAYDLDGNMTRRTNKTTGAVVEYAWDLRNRLTDVTFKSSATGPATKKVHYTYDALNRRIGKSVDTDGNGTLDQVDWFANRGLRTDRENAGDEVMLRLGASGNVTGRYLHGASVDEILAEENIAANGTRDVLWPLADQQGSVRDIVRLGTNGQATVVDHIMYGPYGEKVAETDAAVAHLYGYTGREFDRETGLQYNRARWYDPSTGRWVSKDPIGFAAGDTNLYRYVGNKVTTYVDPSGLAESWGQWFWGWFGYDKNYYDKKASRDLEIKRQVEELSTVANGSGCEVAWAAADAHAHGESDLALALINEASRLGLSPYQIDEIGRQYFGEQQNRLGSLEAGRMFGQQMGMAAVPLVIGMGRTGAFNQAKRDAGIPRGQQPFEIRRVPLTDRNGKQILDSNGKPIMTREYVYKREDGSTVIIQDHSAGHKFGAPNGEGDQGPHMNVRPPQDTRNGTVPGTKPRYPFDKE